MSKIKNIILSLVLIMILFVSISCSNNNNNNNNNLEEQQEKKTYQVIAPSGTPLLGISEYVLNHQDYVTVTSGSDELVSAWVNQSADIIVMPVNLGSKLYNQKKNYILYKTFVWGNLYLSSLEEIGSFTELANQKIVVFGKNSTPDIIVQSLMKYYDITIDIEYVSDVSQANALLLSSTEYKAIVSAEPSLSALKKKKTIYTIDLQEEWKKISGSGSYPQAGIFVKKELKGDQSFEKELEELITSVTNANNDLEAFVTKAIQAHSTFNTLGEAVLKEAIPNCHFDVSNTKEEEKQLINVYLNKMIELGFTAQVGAIPDEEFYY